MSDKIYQGEIPFDADGNQLHYPNEQHYWFNEWDEKTKIGVTSFEGKAIDLSKFSNHHIFDHELSDWQKKQHKFHKSVVCGVENFIFTDSLKYKSYSRGRSAAYFEFERLSSKTEVTVFLKEFEDIVPHMNKGVVKGRFTFCKRGQNFGCRRLSE